MNSNDRFQMVRAEQARKWLSHPDRARELVQDIQARARADMKLGHLPQCGLTKCHADCKRNKQ